MTTRVLLVEDNPILAELMVRRLTRRGYSVDIAIDAEEALSLVESNPPALILMDMNLPGMDGWTATSRLRQLPQTQETPIIALSAHAMVHHREAAIAAGCNDYVTKPINLDELLLKMTFYRDKATGAD